MKGIKMGPLMEEESGKLPQVENRQKVSNFP